MSKLLIIENLILNFSFISTSIILNDKDQFEDKEIDEITYNNFINPINSDFQLDVISLIKKVDERNLNCHKDNRSKSNQIKFISSFEGKKFDNDINLFGNLL